MSGVRLCLWTAATPRWYMNMESLGGMILTGENRRTRRRTCPSTTLSTKNPTWTDRARTRASAVRGLRLTTWAMSRPTWMLIAFLSHFTKTPRRTKTRMRYSLHKQVRQTALVLTSPTWCAQVLRVCKHSRKHCRVETCSRLTLRHFILLVGCHHYWVFHKSMVLGELCNPVSPLLYVP
jgi:hypothetical protein